MATLTAREQQILTLAWQCFKGDPQVNYNTLAELASLKNAASATTAYHNAKKKLFAKGELTAREREIFALTWKSFENPPSIDYNKLAGLAGLKTAASATTAFYNLKKKLLAAANSNNGSAAGEGKGKTAIAKKRKNLPSARTQGDGEEEEEAVVATKSTKRKRKRETASTEPSPKSAAILAAVDSTAEEDEEVKPNKKAKGRKAKSEMKLEPIEEGVGENEETEPKKKAKGKKSKLETELKPIEEDVEVDEDPKPKKKAKKAKKARLEEVESEEQGVVEAGLLQPAQQDLKEEDD